MVERLDCAGAPTRSENESEGNYGDRAQLAGMITTRRVGKMRFVRAIPSNPLFPAFSRLILAINGPSALLGQKVAGIHGLEAAYLYGSWAAR